MCTRQKERKKQQISLSELLPEKRMNYYDCHADTLTEIPSSENLMHNTCCLDLARVRSFADHYTQIFAVWRDQEEILKAQLRTEDVFWELYERALRLMLEQSAYVEWCKDASDMKKAHAQGKAAVFLSVEDVSVMGSFVDQIRDLGFRFAMLTWNYENTYGCGAVTDQAKGLTKEGCALVKQLVCQKVVLDLSHLSDQGVEDVFSLTDQPVLVSHSNVRRLCDHPRNLKKEHIQELIRRNGLLGMNFYKEFVGKQPDLTQLLRHMDYVLELGGEDILAFGGDFDGCGNQMVQGITGVQAVPYLKSEMQHMFGEEAVEKIFWKNADRFLTDYLN